VFDCFFDHAGVKNSLWTKYPQYDIDWDSILPRRAQLRLDTGRSTLKRPIRPDLIFGDDDDEEDVQTFEYAKAINDTISRIVSSRSPWEYGENSCHLDCWLMEELALYGYLAAQPLVTSPLTDNVVMTNLPLQRLLRVLLQAGNTDHQDVAKKAYWIKEIEDYELGTQHARKGFNSTADYHRHGDLLGQQMGLNPGVNFNKVVMKLISSCTNPLHTLQTTRTKRIPVIEVSEFWYSLPDEWAFTRGEDDRVKSNTSHQVAHEHFGDLMHTVIGRPDGETSDCSTCRKKEATNSFQITWTKDVHSVLLPLSLSFGVDTHQILVPEETMLVGGVQYVLLSVVFGNGAHFYSNVKLGHQWFHYDGLGVSSAIGTRTRAKKVQGEPGEAGGGLGRQERGTSGIHRLIRIPPGSTFLTPHAQTQAHTPYKPVSYRYVRTDPTTMDPVPLKDPSEVPTDLQFNDMWRLLPEGY
jgi:hypothetical protein